MHRLKFRGKPRDFLDCYQKYGVVSVNLDSFCRDTASRVRRFQKRENHRAGTERTGVVRFVRLLQLSAAGEVFLEGTCPLSRRPQTAKFPAPCFWRTEKVGEKSDSFSRAERTRPLRPVCRLLCCDLENVPVERFQRVLSCFKRKRTRHAVSLRIYTNSKMFHVKQKAPLRCFT